MDTSNRLLLITQVVVGFITVIWGRAPALLQLLLIFMAADIVSGIIAGAREKDLSSDTAYFGIRKKAVMLVLVLAVAALQIYAREYVGDVPVTNFLAGFFSWYEFNSILENAVRAGVPIPAWLREVLSRLPGVEQPPEDASG